MERSEKKNTQLSGEKTRLHKYEDEADNDEDSDIPQMKKSGRKTTIFHPEVKARQLNLKIKHILVQISMSLNWKKVAEELLDHQIKRF